MKGVHVRKLITRDIPDVVGIESRSFADPWNSADFKAKLRKSHIGALVAADERQAIHGFVLYAINRDHIEIFNLAVDPAARGCGIGVWFIERLVERLHPYRRTNIRVHVRESNVAFQIFLRKFGFLVFEIKPDFYEGTDDAAYLFQRYCTAPCEAVA